MRDEPGGPRVKASEATLRGPRAQHADVAASPATHKPGLPNGGAKPRLKTVITYTAKRIEAQAIEDPMHNICNDRSSRKVVGGCL